MRVPIAALITAACAITHTLMATTPVTLPPSVVTPLNLAHPPGVSRPILGQDHAELLSIAHQYLTDQVNSVTENKQFNRSIGTNQLPLNRLTGTLRNVVQQEIPRIKAFRDRLRGTKAEHDWGRAELMDPKITMLGALATMTATEHSELHYKYLDGSTRYTVQHIIGFVKNGPAWSIASDVIANPGEIEPSAYERKGLQTASGLTSKVSPKLGSALDPQNVETPESRLRGIGLRSFQTILPLPTQKASGYNGDAAADYALKYTDKASVSSRISPKRNPAYPAYPNDCTNFASQALRAGGWADDVPNGWYARPPSSIGFGAGAESRPPVQSDTGPAWRMADSLYRYGKDTSKRLRDADPRTVRRGDLVFADWARADDSYGHDGHIDHSMIVTTRGDEIDHRTMRVTYHSSDQQDIALAEVMIKQAKERDVSLMKFYYTTPET